MRWNFKVFEIDGCCKENEVVNLDKHSRDLREWQEVSPVFKVFEISSAWSK